MKTTEDRACISIPGKAVTLQCRYPSIRETRRIEDAFAKSGDEAFPGYVSAINSITTGWTGTDSPWMGSVEDALSEIDVLFLRNSLLNDLALSEIEMKKAFLSGAGKQGNSQDQKSAQPDHSGSSALTAGAPSAGTATTAGNG